MRDVLDDLQLRKVRDVSDFEWQRNIRVYRSDSIGDIALGSSAENTEKTLLTPLTLQMLNRTFSYESEFTGCKSGFILTPSLEQVLLVLGHNFGSQNPMCLSGPCSSGKTQAIKVSSLFSGILLGLFNH